MTNKQNHFSNNSIDRFDHEKEKKRTMKKMHDRHCLTTVQNQ